MSKYRPIGKLWMLVLALDSVLRCCGCSAQANYAVSSWTVNGGGGESGDARFSVAGTIGQPDASPSSGGQFSVQGGFWGPAPKIEAPTPTHTPSPEPTATITQAPPTLTPTEAPVARDGGYYVLDSLGGRHAVGNPPIITGSTFFGRDIARDMERANWVVEGATAEDLVLLDGLGATHFLAHPELNIPQNFYFADEEEEFPQGRAVDLVMSADGQGLWVLTDYGGIYRAGSAKPPSESALLPGSLIPAIFGFDVPIDPTLRPSGLANPGGASLRAVSLVVIDIESDNLPEGFIVLDSQGGRRHLSSDGSEIRSGMASRVETNHPLKLLDPTGYAWPLFPGLDIARDMELHSSQAGVVLLDGWGGIHPVPVDVESNPVFFATNRTSNLDNTPRYMVGMPYISVGFDDPMTDMEEDDATRFGSDAASIFLDVEFSSREGGFYTLDRFGGVFAFGTAREDDSSVLTKFEGGPYFYPLLLAEDMEVFENGE